MRRLMYLALGAFFAVSAVLGSAKADCVSECDASTYCDSQTDGFDCARRRQSCYITECNKPTARSYGALAYGSDSQAFGYSYDWRSTDEANRGAMSECVKKGKDCKIVATFSNSCSAVAAGANKRFSVAQGAAGPAARASAVAACTKAGGDKCEVKVWACSFP